MLAKRLCRFEQAFVGNALRKQLLEVGVPRSLFLVKKGFQHGKFKDETNQPIRYNEDAMYSWFHRWLPAVAALLRED